jgi:segregation and condensation protein A
MSDEPLNPAVPAQNPPEPAAELRADAPVQNVKREAPPAGREVPHAHYEKSPADLRKEEESASPFSVTVGQVYDGPLDLLLDLVRRQNIDIYDIPIAKITAQFLAYVEHLKVSDVDTAGEFIYMSALLIHIKSKMLLPRSPADSPEEAEDPRRELVERLLEHERFRNAAQMLQQKRQLEEATWTNPGIREFREAADADQEIAADTLDLARVFRDVIERAKNRPVLDVEEDTVTVRQMIDFVRRRLMMEDRPVALTKLLSNTRSVNAVIAMFLALLELVRLQAILLRQDRGFSEIFIKKNEQFEQAINERLNLQGDWS